MGVENEAGTTATVERGGAGDGTGKGGGVKQYCSFLG